MGEGSVRIFAVDPGSYRVGFAVVEVAVRRRLALRSYRVLEAGVIRGARTDSLAQRLGAVHASLYDLLCEFAPQWCVLETPFMGRFAASALTLGQARGALLTAATRCGIAVSEMTPAAVKKCLTGSGAASKPQVAAALHQQGLLPWSGGVAAFTQYDVSDALAIAVAFGISSRELKV